MPKNTKKRTKVKDLPRAKQELTAKAAKKVKGGLLPAVQPSSLGATATSPTLKQGVKKTWDM